MKFQDFVKIIRFYLGPPGTMWDTNVSYMCLRVPSAIPGSQDKLKIRKSRSRSASRWLFLSVQIMFTIADIQFARVL